MLSYYSVQTVPITTVVVYSIQHYVIKLPVTCSRLVVLSPGPPVSSTNKTNHHDITEILLKVALNTITLTLYSVHSTRIQALEWNPQGKRKRGRPKNSWHRGIISELQVINTTWGEAKRKDHDRTRWKETVVALCPPWDEVE